jgi:two-component system, cell cycle sensor histidine kinase and response regulator CckA
VTQYLMKAITTIERARNLTGQLLTFAKGGAPVQKVASLFTLIHDTVQFALSGSNVSGHFDLAPDLWLCSIDRNQVGQVIDNIIINAQQAMPNGGTVHVKARNVTLEEHEVLSLVHGDYVKISFTDTGIGILRESLPYIFDPFYTTKSKGHGLGLATCYSIIHRHGGAIDVESEPGRGSTFHVYLPASTEAAGVVDKTEIQHTGSGIFVVMDDEEVMRDTIAIMLRAFGYTVVGTNEGRETIHYFTESMKENRQIAGMILDLTVPGGMGGKAVVS